MPWITFRTAVQTGGGVIETYARVSDQLERFALYFVWGERAGEATRAQLELPRKAHMLISATEVPAFIQRDDMMDQIYRWAIIEAAEAGLRNFGMPMKVVPVYYVAAGEETLWGFDVEIIKEGIKMADLGVNFDCESVMKHEWVGRDEEGFPRNEGNAEAVIGKNLEIWCAPDLDRCDLVA